MRWTFPISYLKHGFINMYTYLRLRQMQCNLTLISNRPSTALSGWLSGERVGHRSGGCELDPRLKRTFFPVYFYPSPLQKHVRKVVGGFGRKVVLVLV